MRFSVSARGHITVKTLCEFNEIVVPKDALVEESATVSNCLVKFLCCFLHYYFILFSNLFFNPTGLKF
jgi:hypothetical protein